MKGLDTGKEKVKKICDVLRRETLEPAEQESKKIVQQAQMRAEEIVKEARAEAEKLKADALKEIEKEKTVFVSSLQQAGKQVLDSLRESIEKKLLNPEIAELLLRPLQDPKVIVNLIQALVGALEKEGTAANLDVLVPRVISPQAINECLMQNVLSKLKNNSVSIGQMTGGIQVKMLNDNISIDITDAALKEWISTYIRQDFRKILFGAG